MSAKILVSASPHQLRVAIHAAPNHDSKSPVRQPVGTLISEKFQVGERSLTTKLAVVIDNLVFQNTHEPASLRRASGEFLKRADSCQQRLLNEIFCQIGLAHPHKRVTVKTIGMLIHPMFRIRCYCLGQGAGLWLQFSNRLHKQM